MLDIQIDSFSAFTVWSRPDFREYARIQGLKRGKHFIYPIYQLLWDTLKSKQSHCHHLKVLSFLLSKL